MSNDRNAFVARYGSIYERSPWVAERAFERAAGVSDRRQLADIFAACVDSAEMKNKLELIRAHPDLAGRAAVQGELAAESAQEQASAGLDRCTAEELEQIKALNQRYSAKFGFPFVMAVRGSSRQDILAAFASRCENQHDTEFSTAITEIHKIARMRLAALDNE